MRLGLLFRYLPTLIREKGWRWFIKNFFIHLRSELGGAILIFMMRVGHNYYLRNWIQDRENRRRFTGVQENLAKGYRDTNPLVSVLIPTYNRGRTLVDRAVASVLRQSYQNFEVIIVGDHCTDNTERLISNLNDRRIRFCNLSEASRYPLDPRKRWMVAGAVPRNKALELCSGDWIAPLDDDDEFSNDHIEVLLRYSLEHHFDMVYGKVQYEATPSNWVEMGSYPLVFGSISHIAVLYTSKLKFLRYDVDCWKYGETADWNMWRRIRGAGARIGFMNKVVGRYFLGGPREFAQANLVHARYWCNLTRCFGVPE